MNQSFHKLTAKKILIYLNKILPSLLYPVTIILVLLAWSLISRKRLPVIIAFVTLWLTCTPYFSIWLISFIEKDQLRKLPAEMQSADAIVVLGGMLGVVDSRSGPIYEWRDPDRYFAGLELMEAKKGRYIIFTGGILPWQSRMQTEGVYLAKVAKQAGVSENQIFVTHDVQNTAQEAVAVKKYLTEHDLDTIILVTSAFHMPRAERIFKNEEINLQTYPVDSKVILSDTTPMDFLPDANAFSTTQLALRELTGRFFYLAKEKLMTVN